MKREGLEPDPAVLFDEVSSDSDQEF
jgi:hypothetical protein